MTSVIGEWMAYGCEHAHLKEGTDEVFLCTRDNEVRVYECGYKTVENCVRRCKHRKLEHRYG